MKSTAMIIFESIKNGKIDQRTGLDILESLKKNEDNKNHDIAVIGISGVFPKAKNMNQFWGNIKNGVDCVSKFPENRQKDTDKYLYYTGKGNSNTEYYDGAYLDEIDKFDNEFFHISPREASLMNPYQRMFLEEFIHLIEDGGYGGKRLYGSNTGIYIGYSGDSFDDYKDFIMTFEPEAMSEAFVGNMSAMMTGRVSHMFDLRGPNMLIDTACSASMTAIVTACNGIRNGECDLAVAGGIRLILLRTKGIVDVGIESSVNRARTFDDSSDGTGAGEGLGLVLLKPLDKAIQDRDNIHAVIKGIAMNHDGKSIGVTAPNVLAQERLLVKAWKDAGIHPETISYLEAHGTGTKLGDPIEIESLRRAFQRFTQKKQFCAISSVKTNIGHLDGTAGIAGLLKAVLALKNKQLPPSIHFQKPNRNILFEESPVYVNNKLINWNTDGYPRRCGVSSFGISGTNCHIVLEEAPAFNVLSSHDSLHVFTLSAKCKESIIDLVRSFIDYLEDCRGDIADICYTANTGRGHYSYRMAVIASDMEELKYRLNHIDYINMEEKKENWFFYGHYIELKSGKEKRETDHQLEALREKNNISANEIIEKYKEIREYELIRQICMYYVSGADINWVNFYKKQKYNKISLPVYPFQRKRLWVKAPDIPQNEQDGYMDNLPNHLFKNEHLEMNEDNKVKLTGNDKDIYTDIETEVALIWKQALGFERFYIHEEFYSLGGDSIIAIKITNLISRKYHIRFEVSDMLANPTISKMAALIEKMIEKESDNDLLRIEQTEKAEYYPLSSPQKRIYIMNYMEGVNTAYNEPGVVAIEGTLNKKRLESAFHKLIDCHESLRTAFVIKNEEPVQVIYDEVEFKIEFSKVKEGNIAGTVDAFIKKFDLTKPPLMRVLLLETEARNLLVFDIHHLISDGTSVSLIVKDLMCFYEGMEPEGMRLQYKDYAVWQNRLLTSDRLKKQKQFWNGVFSKKITPLTLPTDSKRPEVQSFKGAVIRDEINSELTNNLKQLAEREGVTMYMLLMCAYNILLGKYSGQEDIVVGIAVSGRNYPDVENIVGVFVNTLAIRSYPEGEKTFLQFLSEVKNHMLDAYSNQDYPFELLTEDLKLEHGKGRNPLFDTMFIMQNSGLPEYHGNGITFRLEEIENKSSKFDIKLEAFELNGVIKLSMDYCTALFEESTIRRFVKDYIKILLLLSINCNQKLSNIELDTSYILPEAVAIQMDFNF